MIVWRPFVLECCKFSCAALPLALVTAIAPALAEAGEALLEPGSSRVEVRLELPHLSDTDATKEVVICVDGGKDPTAALRALSTNNPLADCPVHGHRISGDTIHFEVACKGTNAAKGSAVFQLDHDSYRGRIVMKMGGKNMTMTEHQVGRRMGPCKVSN
jgi:hypothetical protein